MPKPVWAPAGKGRATESTALSQTRETDMSTTKFTNTTGAPVADNTNLMTAGPRGPARQDIWLIEIWMFAGR